MGGSTFESAQAAFWCGVAAAAAAGMLGSLAYVTPLFGPETLPTIANQIINTANSFFSPSVVTRSSSRRSATSPSSPE
jgi:membrane protein